MNDGKLPPEPPGLVLARKVGEEIWIEDGLVKIKVMQINGKQVRLRVVGNVRIDRKEVALARQQEEENDGER